MQARVFHLHTLSALHIGTGQGVGVVDLPIARSKATNLPLVPGSALKGVLRDEAKEQWQLDFSQINRLFGPDSSNDDSHTGAVAFGDAQLLLLPIRSFSGTVAYATCPFILQRYARDLQLDFSPITQQDTTALLSHNSVLEIVSTHKIMLEDLDLNAKQDAQADEWAKHIANSLYPNEVRDAENWREQLTKRLVILPDNIYSFLVDTATEIRMRIRIDRKTRMVKKGALWSEENLPAETVLWGVMGISQAHDKSGQSAAQLSDCIPAGESNIQLGGKHTVGRGLCRLLIAASTTEQ